MFGGIYLGKKFATDVFFIMVNIRLYCQINAGEFEGLLYTILSEEHFKSQIFYMKVEMDDYIIYDYVSQNFGIVIGETMTCLTCHYKIPPKLLKDELFILTLVGHFTQKEKIETN